MSSIGARFTIATSSLLLGVSNAALAARAAPKVTLGYIYVYPDKDWRGTSEELDGRSNFGRPIELADNDNKVSAFSSNLEPGRFAMLAQDSNGRGGGVLIYGNRSDANFNDQKGDAKGINDQVTSYIVYDINSSKRPYGSTEPSLIAKNTIEFYPDSQFRGTSTQFDVSSSFKINLSGQSSVKFDIPKGSVLYVTCKQGRMNRSFVLFGKGEYPDLPSVGLNDHSLVSASLITIP